MELKKSCSTKATEYDERVKARSLELVAIAETIKILNDDDALDLFKKTLPSPSLLQLENRNKVGFEKVLKMIDELVVQLGKEQEDDDAHLKWCSAEFDTSEDTEKDLKRRISGLETKIAEAETGIATLIDELAILKQGIK